MLSWALAVALVAAFLAGTVSGFAGFGLALISVPLLLFVYDPTTVVVLTAIFSVFINAAVVWDSWREADRRLAFALVLPAFVGLFAGVEILSVVDSLYIRLAVGVVVVFSALLLLRDVRIPGAGTRWGPVAAGSASGTLSTSTGLAGPPIVLLLASRDLPKHVFRSTSALYFLIISIVTVPLLFFRGLIEGYHVPLALVLIPATFLGKVIGTSLLKRVSEKTFRVLSLVVVMLTGLLGVATALWALR